MRSWLHLAVLTVVAALALGSAGQAAGTVATTALDDRGVASPAACHADDGGGDTTPACAPVCAMVCAGPPALSPSVQTMRVIAPGTSPAGFGRDALVGRLEPPEPAPPRPHD